MKESYWSRKPIITLKIEDKLKWNWWKIGKAKLDVALQQQGQINFLVAVVVTIKVGCKMSGTEMNCWDCIGSLQPINFVLSSDQWFLLLLFNCSPNAINLLLKKTRNVWTGKRFMLESAFQCFSVLFSSKTLMVFSYLMTLISYDVNTFQQLLSSHYSPSSFHPC